MEVERGRRTTGVGAGALVAGGSPSVATGSSVPAATADPGVALQRDFVRAVNAVRPSVVEVSTSSGLGSGVVYDTKGDIVTNAHVVGDATTFTVSLSNGTRLAGRLVGTFAPDDLAVLRVSSPTRLTPARFAASKSVQVGDIVLAVGNPLGLSSSVTDGIVSFNGRTLDEGNGVVLAGLIQTSAAINPGNSGGALVDIEGRVIGIPTLGASSGSSAAAGLGFAIPSDTITLIVPQLVATGRVTTAGRAALGVSGATAVSFAGEPIGVVVTAVQPGGPAARAGIAVGELITAVNGHATRAFTDLEAVLAELRPGTRAIVATTSPGGARRNVSVVLADLAAT
ncbi:MAG: trypsin-like peptidase domain-containing protein [Actinomycetota bacterium]|nr:trypsin-like peptidase domain-containing protein [Actinomycetota bacterium]